MKAGNFILAIVVAAAICGCAGPSANVNLRLNPGIDNPSAVQEQAKIGDFLLEPHDTTGIKETPALLQRNVSCFRIPFPEELKKEQKRPERIKWYALVTARGFEHLGQLLKRHLLEKEGELLVDGNTEALKNAKVIVLSTRNKRVYNLSSPDAPGVVIDSKKFESDWQYRQSLVEQYGTPLSHFPKADNLIATINSWNRFESLRGVYILTPLDEETFKEIVAINPGYSHSQKLVKNGKWYISTDPAGMAINNLIMNNIRAATAKSSGWDIDSE